MIVTCSDPDSFFQGGGGGGGQTLTTFFCGEMREEPYGHYRPASETPFKRRFTGKPMMAHNQMLAL